MKLLNKRICIILSIIIVLCCFVSNLYWDEWITQRHGIDFLHFLFKGQISDFYRHCAEETEVAAAYDLTLYVIFAIWNIPCYLYELITKQNSQSLFIFVLWGKSLVLVGYIISILCFKKLYSIVNVNVTGIDASLYYALSPFLLIYCIYTGNYDVLAVVVIMLGIISLFEKRNNMFLLLFSVAISMKYFAVLIFIPIILLKEKKINKIFIELTLGVSLTLIEKIFFSNNFRETRNSAGFAVDLIRKSSTINIIEKTSVFAVFYILICVYCYYKDNMSEEDIKKKYYFFIGNDICNIVCLH